VKFRIGLWIVALALLASVMLVGIDAVLAQFVRVHADVEPYQAVATATQVVGTVLAGAIAAGCIVCARDTRGHARFWLAIAGLACAAHIGIAIAGALGVQRSPITTVLGGLWLFAPAFFAFAMLWLNRGRTLASVSIVVLALNLIGLALLGRTVLEARLLPASPFAAYIAWAFLVLDVLDAFPAVGPIPSVTVATIERKLARIVGVVMLVVGLAMMSAAVWASGKRGAMDSAAADVVMGSLAFLAGALGLWRLRGRGASVVIGGAIALGLCVATPFALRWTIPAPEEVELGDVDLGGATIALPEGTRVAPVLEHELGAVAIVPQHRGLGRIEVSWGDRPHDVVPRDTVFEISGHHFVLANPSVDGDDVRTLTWQCATGTPVYVISVSLPGRHRAVAETLLRRIAATLRCR
jgi:hypothetical protein